VLLIKTAWGGRSLYKDFRSPSAGPPADAVVQKLLTNKQKKTPAATAEEVRAEFGSSYREMLTEVNATLEKLKGTGGFELCGLVWFQGWNDMVDAAYTAAYAENLACFIRDVRSDLKSPSLPVVVGQMGVHGKAPDANVKRFKDAQSAGVDRPEFRGNVALVKTDAYWDTDADAVFKKGWRENKAEWDTVGSDYPYHYLGSAKTMSDIGRGFGEAMLGLMGEK
jgi:alpha-galactosidase